ncbi:hypothetical protein BGZ83_001604 [Gryganskiella cystojenkinii]|nr:hypothetical protein BGZ83_001604 [Gryganskiella cystojenkinii]
MNEALQQDPLIANPDLNMPAEMQPDDHMLIDELDNNDGHGFEMDVEMVIAGAHFAEAAIDDVPELEPSSPVKDGQSDDDDDDDDDDGDFGDDDDDDQDPVEPAENSPYLYRYPSRHFFHLQPQVQHRFGPNAMEPWVVSIMTVNMPVILPIEGFAPWG